MSGYSVFLPKTAKKITLTNADKFVFVKEGLSWLAIISPLLWSVFQGLWRLAVFIIIFIVLMTMAMNWLDISTGYRLLLTVLFNIIFAIEAPRLQALTLEARGYQLEAFVSGDSETQCQRQFLKNWLSSQNANKP